MGLSCPKAAFNASLGPAFKRLALDRTAHRKLALALGAPLRVASIRGGDAAGGGKAVFTTASGGKKCEQRGAKRLHHSHVPSLVAARGRLLRGVQNCTHPNAGFSYRESISGCRPAYSKRPRPALQGCPDHKAGVHRQAALKGTDVDRLLAMHRNRFQIGNLRAATPQTRTCSRRAKRFRASLWSSRGRWTWIRPIWLVSAHAKRRARSRSPSVRTS